MKKLIVVLLALVTACSSLLFHGCVSSPKKEIALEITVRRKLFLSDEWIETKHEASVGENDKTYYLSYDLCEDMEIRAVLKTNENDSYSPALLGESDPDLSNLRPGTYNLEREYEGYGKITVKLNVFDTRPEVELDWDGGDLCVEYAVDVAEHEAFYGRFGEVTTCFLYEYDGGWHYPELVLSYGGEELARLTEDDISHYIEWNDEESIIISDKNPATDRGIYYGVLRIDSDIFEGENKGKFRDVVKNVAIRIR